MTEYANAAFRGRRRPRAKLWATLIGAFLVVLLAFLYSVFWYETAARTRAAIEAWIAEQRAAGHVVTIDDMAVGGFPFSISVTASRAAFSRTDGRTYAWRGAAVRASARPWSPRRLHLSAAGNTLTYAAPATAREVALEAAALNATVQLARDGRVRRLDGRFEHPVLSVPDVPEDIRARWVEIEAAQPGDTGASVEIDVLDVTSALDPLQRLGGVIDRIRASLELKGMPAPAATVDQALETWRTTGGAVELKEARLEMGTLAADASGTFALDEELRPIGAMTASFLGLIEFIDRLAQAGLVEARDATIAKLTVNLLAERTESGRLRLPVTLQFGQVAIGPLVLGNVPPLPDMLANPDLRSAVHP